METLLTSLRPEDVFFLYILYGLCMYMITVFYFLLRRTNHGIKGDSFQKSSNTRKDYFIENQRRMFFFGYLIPIFGWMGALLLLTMVVYEVCIYFSSIVIIEY